ncbi:MAG: site-specific integrase [Rhodothermales bacterium]
MATITPVLSRRPKKNGEHSLQLRITDSDGLSNYLSLKVSVRASHWNARSCSVRRTHPNHEAINGIIAKAVASAKEVVYDLSLREGSVAAADVKDRMRGTRSTQAGASSCDYFEYGDRFVKALLAEGRIYYHKKQKTNLAKFRAFAGAPLPFGDISIDLLQRYKAHLIGHYGNKPGTVATNFRGLKTIFLKAARDGTHPIDYNPFIALKIEGGKPARLKLSEAEHRRILELNLEHGTLISRVRDTFAFSYFTAGMRFGDVCRLRASNVANGRLVYTMHKTGHVQSIVLLPQAEIIARRHLTRPECGGVVDPYVFPILEGYDLSTPRKEVSAISSQNALTNKYLKKIAEVAEVPATLSFHIARHTFADHTRRRGGGLYTISKALGHRSLSNTQTYLASMDTDAVDNELLKIHGNGA